MRYLEAVAADLEAELRALQAVIREELARHRWKRAEPDDAREQLRRTIAWVASIPPATREALAGELLAELARSWPEVVQAIATRLVDEVERSEQATV